MKQTNRSTYEAALDLGATPLYAFYKVTWPEIRPGVFSGFMMAVTMSLDDFPSPILPKEPGSIPSPPCSTQNFAKESNRNCMHFPRFCSLPFCSFFLPEMFIRGRSVLQPNKLSIGILFQPKGVLLWKKNFLCPLNFCSGSQRTHCLWGIFLCEKNGQTLTVLNYGKYIDESVVKQFEKKPVSPSNTKNMKVRKKCIPNTKLVPSTMM